MSEENKNLDPMLAANFGDDYQTREDIDPLFGQNDSEESEETDEDEDKGPENPDAGNMEDDEDEDETPPVEEEEKEEEEEAEKPALPPAGKEDEEETTPPVQPQEKPVVPELTPAARAIIEKLNAGDDKEIYETLRKKYGHTEMSAEDKMINFLVATRPELEQDDILYLLATDYGVGATELDPEDITPEIKDSLKKQELARKSLLRQAETFLEQEAASVTMPELPTLADSDPEYKEYLEFKKNEVALRTQQEQEAAAFEQEKLQTIERVNTTATEIETLSLGVKLKMDEGEFDLSTDFKLNEKMKKQLADYTAEYTPTQAEYQRHTKNGEFDMKGYMTQLAERLFAPQIQKALIKQAIAKDRATFVATELKNSSFSRGERAQFEPEVDFATAAMGK